MKRLEERIRAKASDSVSECALWQRRRFFTKSILVFSNITGSVLDGYNGIADQKITIFYGISLFLAD